MSFWPRIGRLFKGDDPGSFLSQIGVCASLTDSKLLKDSGCAYIEEGVRRFLIPEEPEEKFGAKLAELKEAALPVLACNGFLPGQLKAVGAEAKHDKILAFAETAFRRAARAGVGTIVWGSGESRRIPDGFSRAKAEEQFRDLAKRVAALAGRHGVIVCLEPLNSGETNFVNSLKEGAAVVEAVSHPNLKLLADFYHLLRQGETPDAVETYGKHIHHCHIAEKDKRTPPGTAGDDFKPFFKRLKTAGYQGRISMECGWKSMKDELLAAMTFLRNEIAAS